MIPKTFSKKVVENSIKRGRQRSIEKRLVKKRSGGQCLAPADVSVTLKKPRSRYRVWKFSEDDRRRMLSDMEPLSKEHPKVWEELDALLRKFDKVTGGGWLIRGKKASMAAEPDGWHRVVVSASKKDQLMKIDMILGVFEDLDTLRK